MRERHDPAGRWRELLPSSFACLCCVHPAVLMGSLVLLTRYVALRLPPIMRLVETPHKADDVGDDGGANTPCPPPRPPSRPPAARARPRGQDGVTWALVVEGACGGGVGVGMGLWVW